MYMKNDLVDLLRGEHNEHAHYFTVHQRTADMLNLGHTSCGANSEILPKLSELMRIYNIYLLFLELFVQFSVLLV